MGMQYSRNMVAGYPFENSGADIMGVNPLTMVGATYGVGKSGQCVVFDGVDDNAQVDNFPNVKSATFWLYIESIPVDIRFILIHTSIAIGFFEGNSFILCPSTFGSKRRSDLTGLITGAWNHIYLGYDATNNPTIFINLVEPNYVGFNSWNSSSTTLQVAKRGTANYLNGKIDLLKFYSKELTKIEIQRDYLNLPIF